MHTWNTHVINTCITDSGACHDFRGMHFWGAHRKTQRCVFGVPTFQNFRISCQVLSKSRGPKLKCAAHPKILIIKPDFLGPFFKTWNLALFLRLVLNEYFWTVTLCISTKSAFLGIYWFCVCHAKVVRTSCVHHAYLMRMSCDSGASCFPRGAFSGWHLFNAFN